MLRRLIYLLLTSAAFYCGITFILRFFADILPVASTEEPQSIWRFEMAFVLTAVQWITLAVVGLTAVANGPALQQRAPLRIALTGTPRTNASTRQ